MKKSNNNGSSNLYIHGNECWASWHPSKYRFILSLGENPKIPTKKELIKNGRLFYYTEKEVLYV